PWAYLGEAAILIKQRKLDEASDRAGVAIEMAAERDGRSRAAAHEMLANIAITRHDVDSAREEARLAHDADPTMPLPAYIEGRILYDQGEYEDVLPLLLQAIAEGKKSN